MLKEFIEKVAGEYDYPISSVICEMVEKIKIDHKDIKSVIDDIIEKYAKINFSSVERVEEE